MKIRKDKRGFTLVELLAVIVILIILLLIAIPAISNTVESSRQNTFYNSVSLIVNEIDTEQILGNSDFCIYTYDREEDTTIIETDNVKKSDYKYIDKLYVLVHKENENVIHSVFAIYDKDVDKEDPRTIDLRDFSKSTINDHSTWLELEEDYNSYTYYSVELIESLSSKDSELLKYNTCVFK